MGTRQTWLTRLPGVTWEQQDLFQQNGCGRHCGLLRRPHRTSLRPYYALGPAGNELDKPSCPAVTGQEVWCGDRAVQGGRLCRAAGKHERGQGASPALLALLESHWVVSRGCPNGLGYEGAPCAHGSVVFMHLFMFLIVRFGCISLLFFYPEV